MSAWLLIVTMWTVDYRGGVTVVSIPFATPSACDQARQTLIARPLDKNGWVQRDAVCVETGARS